MATNTLTQPTDPYIRTSTLIQEPPVTFRGIAKHLGPGFVLSAAIVGSGELIATTALGAKAGFIAFWVIIVSCLVKVMLQLEFGKHVIHSGESTMLSLNRLPGPKLGKANWAIWMWLFIQIFKLLQVGGIVGGVAITLHVAFPVVSVPIWTAFVTIGTSLLVYKGYYKTIEKFSLIMIALFSVFTLASLFSLQYSPYAFTWSDVGEGLSFRLPASVVGIAIAAFGITGVGGDEILYYNYWCLEKGYASFTGPGENNPDWIRRAKGWIRVMYIDAFVAMAVYTTVTAAFYLLGAAILHKTGEVPEGYQMVETLSTIYTQTLGPWAKSVFMAGAIIVLYSTLFTAAASWTRIFPDAFGQIGWIDFYNPMVRKKAVAWLAWIFPLSWAALFLFINLPVLMVLLGGFVTSILLLLIVYAAIHFRYKKLPKSLYPGRLYDTAFWISAIAILLTAVYGVIQLFNKYA